MSHPESVTAILTDNEPPDGAVLILLKSGDYKVIVRDDTAAAERKTYPGDHWFEDADPYTDPMSLHQHLKYADAVYALGDKLAEFRR